MDQNTQQDRVILLATNDAAFHVSLDHADLTIADKNYQVNTEMLPPMSSKEFLVRDLKTIPSPLNLQLHYVTVNDFGSVVQHDFNLPR